MPEIAYEKVIYDPLKLAYLAGIVDGEGSLCIYRVNPAKYNRYQTPNFRSVLNISNTKKELFDWIEEHFSNLNHKSKKHKRSIFKKNSTHERWIYEWVIQGHRLVDVCTQLLPYLVLKKEQAKLILKFRKTYTQKSFGSQTPLDPKTVEKREKIRLEMCRLNAKGFLKAEFEHNESLDSN
jgi:hypothetical protein